MTNYSICNELNEQVYAWVKVLRIIRKFRILRLTFHRKLVSKSYILKVSFKILNSAGNNSFSDLVSVYLKVFDH